MIVGCSLTALCLCLQMDSQLACMMSESSVDYIARFNDLAQELAVTEPSIPPPWGILASLAWVDKSGLHDRWDSRGEKPAPPRKAIIPALLCKSAIITVNLDHCLKHVGSTELFFREKCPLKNTLEKQMRLQNTTSCTGRYYAIWKQIILIDPLCLFLLCVSVFYCFRSNPKMCKSAKMCSSDPSRWQIVAPKGFGK